MGGVSSHYSGQEVKESSGRESCKQAIAPKGMKPSVTCFLQSRSTYHGSAVVPSADVESVSAFADVLRNVLS